MSSSVYKGKPFLNTLDINKSLNEFRWLATASLWIFGKKFGSFTATIRQVTRIKNWYISLT
jgi:hypothetical protein